MFAQGLLGVSSFRDFKKGKTNYTQIVPKSLWIFMAWVGDFLSLRMLQARALFFKIGMPEFQKLSGVNPCWAIGDSHQSNSKG